MTKPETTPKFCEAGWVDPELSAHLKKFRSYQTWLDGGPLTEDANEIREMMNAREI